MSEQVLKALASPEAFLLLIPDYDRLLRVVMDFPKYRGECIACVLKHPQVFNHIVTGHEELQWLLAGFSEHKDILIEKFIERALSSPNEFLQSISSASDLQALANDSPKHRDALINAVLSHPTVFNQIVPNDRALQLLELDTQLGALAELVNKRYSEKRIRGFSRLLHQGAGFFKVNQEKNESLLQHLPEELLIKIAAATRDSEAYSQSEAEDIVHQNFCRPGKTRLP